MDDERLDALLCSLDHSATRRAVLAAVAGVAGLRLSETAAKRRQPGERKQRSQAEEQLRVAAADPAAIRITTLGVEGSSGTFTVDWSIEDVGTFTVERVSFSAAGAPTFLIVHTVNEFVSSRGNGTFTLRTQSKLTQTVEGAEGVFTAEGTWVVESGTGGYERLHGAGTITGEIDETLNPDRYVFVFTGTAHLA
jgi:hypothetical protein